MSSVIASKSSCAGICRDARVGQAAPGGQERIARLAKRSASEERTVGLAEDMSAFIRLVPLLGRAGGAGWTGGARKSKRAPMRPFQKRPAFETCRPETV